MSNYLTSKANSINKQGKSVRDPVCSIHAATLIKKGLPNYSPPLINCDLSSKHYFVSVCNVTQKRSPNFWSFTIYCDAVASTTQTKPCKCNTSKHKLKAGRTRRACSPTAQQKPSSTATHDLDETNNSRMGTENTMLQPHFQARRISSIYSGSVV